MKVKIKRIILLILIIINCFVIFGFSGQNGEKSGSISGEIAKFIANIIPSIKNMEENEKFDIIENILHPLIRKLAHFSIYAFLGLLTISFSNTYKTNFKIKVILTLLFCFIYSCTDEIHQLFVGGRSGNFVDIYIDTLGASTGITFGLILDKINEIIRKKHKIGGK